jgi:hypothetical protein
MSSSIKAELKVIGNCLCLNLRRRIVHGVLHSAAPCKFFSLRELVVLGNFHACHGDALTTLWRGADTGFAVRSYLRDQELAKSA